MPHGLPDVIDTADAADKRTTTDTLEVGQIAPGTLATVSDLDWLRPAPAARLRFSSVAEGKGRY